jgi:hypothetical protein
VIIRYLKGVSTGKVQGNVLGVKLEYAGPAAIVVGLILVLFFALKSFNSDSREVSFTLAPPNDGDETSIAILKEKQRGITLLLSSSTQDVLRIDGFEYSENKKILFKRQLVPGNLIGKKFSVTTEPSLVNAVLDRNEITLTDDVSIVLAGRRTASPSWKTALDLKHYTVGPRDRENTLKHVLVLEPPSDLKPDTLSLNGYVGYGDGLRVSAVARLAPADSSLFNVDFWARKKLQNQDLEEIFRQFDATYALLRTVGHELGTAENLISAGQSRHKSHGQLRLDNTAPVVGPIIRTSKGPERLVVLVELNSSSRNPVKSKEEDHLGELYPLPTQRSVFLVKSLGGIGIEPQSVRAEYKINSAPHVQGTLEDTSVR